VRFPTGDLPLHLDLCLVQERGQSRGTLRIFDLTEYPLPADSMPALADILLERFVYPGRLPPVIPLAQSRLAPVVSIAATSSCGRISCAHRNLISPCPFLLHSVRVLQRLVSRLVACYIVTHEARNTDT
jgi:hypothetical protein